MADRQIYQGAVRAAPDDYHVNDAVRFILKAVNATFDGSGAASSYLPCVTLISDSGHAIARAVDPAVTVAAGASAEVSWFPGVKSAAAAGSATSVLSWFSVDTGFNNQVIGTNSAGFVTFNRAGASWSAQDDSANPWFAPPGTGGGGNPYPQLLRQAYVLATITTNWGLFPDYRYCTLQTPGTPVIVEMIENESEEAINNTFDNRLGWIGPVAIGALFGSPVPVNLTVQVYQSSGVDQNLQHARLHVAVLGAQY